MRGRLLSEAQEEAKRDGSFGGVNMTDAQIDSRASASAGHSLGTAKEDLRTIACRLYSAGVTTPFLGTESQQLAGIRQAYLSLPGANPKGALVWVFTICAVHSCCGYGRGNERPQDETPGPRGAHILVHMMALVQLA